MKLVFERRYPYERQHNTPNGRAALIKRARLDYLRAGGIPVAETDIRYEEGEVVVRGYVR